jgi:hypothetical protein
VGAVIERPLVHVVVVDHDGGDLTLACLRSIVASDWPADRLRIVLVDNASKEPVTDAVAAELPTVSVIRSDTNLGFAGGANLGLRERDDADFVALVNNDATVTPAWLAPLVATFTRAPDVGAACPKILLAAPAVEVVITTPTHRRGHGDNRALGIRVSGARIPGSDGRDVWPRTQLVDGFWGFEPMPPGETAGQWTTDRAVLRVPVDPGPTRPRTSDLALRLGADQPTLVSLATGTTRTDVVAGPGATWHSVASDADPVEVINNVGSVLTADGYGVDRGWLQVDRGQFDTPVDVDLWCGAAVLLSRPYLDDVGLFDERLFLYYEDVELSLRGRAHGWRYRSAPESVVRHLHAASSGEGSALKERFNERNRLLVATRHDGPARATALSLRYLLTTASYLRRDVAAPWLRRESADSTIVRRRLVAFGAYLRAAPGALRSRRVDRSAGRP